MARVPYLPPPSDLPPYNIFKAMAQAENIYAGYADLGVRFLSKGELDPAVRELVINAIAIKLNSEYEWSHHVGLARAVGVPDSHLQAVRDGRTGDLPPVARACVEFACRVDDRIVSDFDVQGLRAMGLSEAQIVELTLLAGFYGMTARFLDAMDIERDEGTPTFNEP